MFKEMQTTLLQNWETRASNVIVVVVVVSRGYNKPLVKNSFICSLLLFWHTLYGLLVVPSLLQVGDGLLTTSSSSLSPISIPVTISRHIPPSLIINTNTQPFSQEVDTHFV
jgi:hypothetical protein